jgi:FMN phosphatase YigB (HAD superfamily)
VTAPRDELPQPRADGGDPLARFDLRGVKMMSFDVFDTLLTRRVGEPASAFVVVGRRLRAAGLTRCTPEAFGRARYVAEKRARRHADGAEITLEAICRELAVHLGTRPDVHAMMRIERETERRLLAAIPAMREAVRAARERFGRVVFVSDMYLDQSFIRGLLSEHGLLEEGDGLYVSSTHGVQKGDGRLFRVMLEKEGISPRELLHVGNSEPYDVAPAKRVGFRAHHFDEGNAHPGEAVLESHAASNGVNASCMAGAAKLARLDGLHVRGAARTAWETGASVTGPFVHLYARWVVERACALGVKRLLFLARDAYLPMLAVRALLERRPELGIETSYLCGSRVTYLPLGVEELDEKQWDTLTSYAGRAYATADDLARSLCVRRETFAQLLSRAGLSGRGGSDKLSAAELAELKRIAIEDKRINAELLADLRAYQDLQRRYLEQEGLRRGERAALVDTGWTTRSHAPLYDFLVREGHADLRVFYIGLMVEQTKLPHEAIDTFMFDRTAKTGAIRHGMQYPRCLETLLLSSDGRTCGFEQDADTVAARFEPLEDRAFVERYYGAYEEGVRAFLQRVAEAEEDADSLGDPHGLAEEIASRFWLRPTRPEAELWSQLAWEWDPHGDVKFTLARSYRPADVWRAFAQRGYPEVQQQFWIAAAKRLTPATILWPMRLAIHARRALMRAGNILPDAWAKRLTRWRRRWFEPNRAVPPTCFVIGLLGPLTAWFVHLPGVIR